MKYKLTPSGILFDTFKYTILIFATLVALFPFIYILAVSVAPMEQVLRGGIILIPKSIDFSAYKSIFSTRSFMGSMNISIFITVVGTIASILITSLMAYPLSKGNRLPGNKVIGIMVIISMVFSPGMVPKYMVVQWTGLYDTLAALIVPSLISVWNLIVMRNFFSALPEELEESAYIDGAKTIQIFWKIILPLSKPALAAFTLFYAVAYWNTFTAAILYLNKASLWPIQVMLRQIVIDGMTEEAQAAMLATGIKIMPKSIQMAAIFVAAAPILCIYPFLQKHFAKGVMVGSVKG